jgi:2,3-bisphosphoglycerate-independent phosphoglycerate mutase
VPPHDIPNAPIAANLPCGPGSEWVRDLMTRAHQLLTNHEINLVRRDLGENPATHIWLWGQGRQKPLPRFEDMWNVRGAVIAAVDLIRGIARSAGMTVIDVPGATGYLDTDYAAKGEHAVKALDEFDLVIVHVEAPDEAGHQGDAREKVLAIERVDQLVVSPLLEKLRTFEAWRILVAPDHPTPVDKRVHTSDPPPFCMAGHALATDSKTTFSECSAATGDVVDPGHGLISLLLGS